MKQRKSRTPKKAPRLYIVILPPRREAYAKLVRDLPHAVALMQEKIGTAVSETRMQIDGEETPFTLLYHAGKGDYRPYNERASYYSALPEGQELRGTVAVLQNTDGVFAPLHEVDMLQLVALFNEEVTA